VKKESSIIYGARSPFSINKSLNLLPAIVIQPQKLCESFLEMLVHIQSESLKIGLIDIVQG